MSTKKKSMAGLSVARPQAPVVEAPDAPAPLSKFAASAAKETTKRFNAKLPESLHKKLKRHCFENDVTATDWLIEQIEKL